MLLFFIISVDKVKINNPIFFYNSDIFNINIFKKTFESISNYLDDKYTINNLNTHKESNYPKKVIKVKGMGLFNKIYFQKWIKNKLDDEFLLVFEDQNPDYLLYNVFTDEDIKPIYHNAIRIAIYTTENIIPDINNADYIIGQYHINYLDRYFKYSCFLWQNFSIIEQKRKEAMKNKIKRKFCGAVISNCRAEFRMNFIDKLNKYKKVDFGGKCRNNVNGTVKNKIEFLSDYKFSISMENSKGDGYITEKIAQSYIAGTIPIYYGDYILDEYLNPKTYILIRGEKDIDNKIDYIKKIDNNDTLYETIMKEKPIIDDNFVNKIDNYEIKLFFIL